MLLSALVERSSISRIQYLKKVPHQKIKNNPAPPPKKKKKNKSVSIILSALVERFSVLDPLLRVQCKLYGLENMYFRYSVYGVQWTLQTLYTIKFTHIHVNSIIYSVECLLHTLYYVVSIVTLYMSKTVSSDYWTSCYHLITRPEVLTLAGWPLF